MSEENEINKEKALDKPRDYSLATPGQIYYPQNEEEVHLRDYLHVVLRRKWIVITFFIAVVTTVVIGTFIKKPVYKSTITIKIDKENPNILSFKDVVNLEKIEDDYYQTQYKVLKSRNLAKRVVHSLNLFSYPEFSSFDENKKQNTESNLLDKQNSSLEDDKVSPELIDSFINRIEVSPVQKSRLVNVSFQSNDPYLAAKVSNAIGDAFIELNIESKFQATNQAKTWLEKQLDEMKAKVEQAEEKLNEYAAKNGIIFLDKTEDSKGKATDNQNIITKRLSELSSELTTATAERISKEALCREMHSGEQESSSVVMNNPLMLELKKNYVSLDAEYNQMLKIYKPDYPKMIRLQEQINQIKKKMDIETKRIISSVKKDYEVAVKRENQLKAALNSLKNEALSLNERAIQYQILKREADTNKELYNGLLQRLKETGVSASLTASNIQILDRAEIPKKPYKPNWPLNIMLSLVVGIFGGIGLAFFTEYLDDTIKTPEDVEKKAYMPSLGIVPNFSEEKSPLQVEYVSHEDSKLPISEAYRSIRTFLLLSSGGKPPRVMMITSPDRGEGKTTTSVNTAVSLTQSGFKVLLIDADMRKPRLHRIFKLDNTIGLANYLSGNAEIDNGLIKHCNIENLYVITSGPIPPNPAELLSSYRLRDLIQNIYSDFNFIIVDTPPVLGIADPLIVSHQTDGVIIIVRSGKTAKYNIKETKRILEGVNAKILGVILNSVNQSTMKYSYYYYRHYYTDEKK
ncbi:MAG: polysaccharide biosynthesis tyrosine autokinase [Nitrospirae bacterium]|jgi:capsular exopolysaccharide synthesis family protein|nr:polysaccharide biosynthesis tyrosine autokinase [Nitrospirota bacterium]